MLAMFLNAGAVYAGVSGGWSKHTLMSKVKKDAGAAAAADSKKGEWEKFVKANDGKNGGFVQADLGYVHCWTSKFYTALEVFGGGAFGKQKSKKVEGVSAEAVKEAAKKEAYDNFMAFESENMDKKTGEFLPKKDTEENVKARADLLGAVEKAKLTDYPAKDAVGEVDMFNPRMYVGVAVKPGFMVMDKLGVHAIAGIQVLFPSVKWKNHAEIKEAMVAWSVGAGACYGITDNIGAHVFYTYNRGFDNTLKGIDGRKFAYEQHKVGAGVAYKFSF